MKTVEILSIKKNEILIRKPQRVRFGVLMVSIAIIIFTLAIFSHEGLNDITSSMVYVYNPVNSLYSDNSGVVFTSGLVLEKESLDFVIPIKSSQIEIDDFGTLSFEVGASIMVMSPESGVVDEVGFSLDGKKYIKIRHSVEVYSIIQNVDMIGVSVGQVIKRGEDIATSKEGSVLTMQILSNNTPISGLKINQSKIVWKS